MAREKLSYMGEKKKKENLRQMLSAKKSIFPVKKLFPFAPAIAKSHFSPAMPWGGVAGQAPSKV